MGKRISDESMSSSESGSDLSSSASSTAGSSASSASYSSDSASDSYSSTRSSSVTFSNSDSEGIVGVSFVPTAAALDPSRHATVSSQAREDPGILKQYAAVQKSDPKRVSLALDISHAERIRRTSVLKTKIDDKFLELNNWHTMEAQEVAKHFGTELDFAKIRSSKGLTAAKVAEKQARGEVNQMTPPKSHSEFVKFLLQFTDIFMLLLLAASGLCFLIYGIDPIHDPNNLYIACLLVILVILTCTFSYLQERQTDKVMETFGKLMASAANVIRDGKQIEIPAKDVVTGDLLVLRAGEKCAADVRLIDIDGLRSDNSSMTGESEPVQATLKSTSEVAVQSRNLCWSGSLVVDGGGVGIVINIGDDTLIGKVAHLASATVQVKSILEREILRFVKMSSALSVILAAIIVGLGAGRHFKAIPVVIAAISIVLANVPQGLPPAVTTVLALTAQALQKRNVFVKRLDIVETLGSCTVIASDKTGTLTQNKMTAMHTWPSRAPHEAVDEATYESIPSMRSLGRVLILCNRINVDKSVKSLEGMEFPADASEIGLFKRAFALPKYHEIRHAYNKVAEVPFNSVHKWQLSLHQLPPTEAADFATPLNGSDPSQLFLLAMKGAPEILLGLCGRYYAREGNVAPGFAAFTDFVKAQITSYASQGERVLGFCDAYITAAEKAEIETTRELPESVKPKLTFAGLCTMLDPPKVGVAEAVLQCHAAGIKVIMVTGDFPVTAAAIAKQVNIFSDTANPSDQAAYAGADILGLSEAEWDKVLCKPRLVFARMQPEHKLLIVEQLQRRGEVVAVTGDGVNDSPALKRADVGIAMGIAGTEVAKEAAKIICTDDNFASIVEGIRYGRIIFDNLRKTIMLVVTHLIPEAWPFLFTYIFSMPLGLSPLLLLAIDLGTEMLPSICIAYEGPESDVMKMPPRNLKKDRLVTLFSISHAYLEIGMLETVCCLALYLHLLMVHYMVPSKIMGGANDYFAKGSPDLVRTDGGVWTDTQQVHIIHEVQSLWFATIAACQIGHVLSIRGVREASWRLDRNIKLYGSCLISSCIVVLLVFTPGIKKVFLSRPFPPGYWIGVILAGLVIWLTVEAKKAGMRACASGKKRPTDRSNIV